MLDSCYKSIIGVLNRQYKMQFSQSDYLKEVDLTSARQHTMDAESIIGEFSEFNKSKRNITVSNLIKGKNNGTKEFLTKCADSEFIYLVKKAIPHSRLEMKKDKLRKINIQQEIETRINNKNAKEEDIERKKLANKSISPQILNNEFPGNVIPDLVNILKGNIIGRNITHIWSVDNENVEFKGKVLEFKNNKYKIYYYRFDLIDCDEEDFEIVKYEVGADYLRKDLFFH